MMIKLIKEVTIEDQLIPIDSVIEVEDTLGQSMIDNETAILYTSEEIVKEEVELIEETSEVIKQESKKIKKENKSIFDLSTQGKMKMNLFGKAIKDAIETKAVTTYAGTEATEPLGVVSFDIGLGQFCNKMNINGNLNIVYSATESTSAELPAFDIVAESTAAATTVALTQYSSLPAKYFATVTVPNEYIEDVAQMESYVSRELTNKANRVMDKSILRGAFTNNYGLKGVVTSSDTVTVTATLSAIAITDLHEMVDSIIPELQKNAIWVINPTTWSQLKGSFLDSENINSQLIQDGSDKKLLGYPVKVSTALIAAAPIVFGDFSQYLIGINKALQIETDRSVAFLTDATALKVCMRLSGGPACSIKSIDGVSYGAFAKMTA